MAATKTKIILIQLGSPLSPKVRDVRVFLRNFLSDPRVVDLDPRLWKLILNLFILPFRPAQSAKAYARIWTDDGSPLVNLTRDFALALERELQANSLEVDVRHAFILGRPSLEEVIQEADKILFVPQFPQYSEATTASAMDVLFKRLEQCVQWPEIKNILSFHRSRAFIDSSVEQIYRYICEHPQVEHVLLSFHGLPKRRVLFKGDPYYQHCLETAYLIEEKLAHQVKQPISFAFQSRFGSEEWLTPYTIDRVQELAQQGTKHIAVYCPSFTVDCLETLDEIGNELREICAESGGELGLIPCLNVEKHWVQNYAQYLTGVLSQKAPAELEYNVAKEKMMQAPEQVMETPPLSDKAKKSLKLVFLTLFLDLIGFSIIFPMFPALAKYYLETDANNPFLQWIFSGIQVFMQSGGAGGVSPIVLFGGALGALYSLLQFVCAPFWGALSDKVGRRPILLISIAGLALSYLMWFFSGSFSLLILARTIGGIMGGNISTATAVVADVTQEKNRSKGMATIGIAFALGFIIGPALGGFSTQLNLLESFPELARYGVNPFSMAALIAFLLSVWNLFFIWRKFEETLPAGQAVGPGHTRSSNLLKLFKPLPYAGVNLTNFGHFFFLTAFSGMEFTLTFLAVERLGYSSLDNAYMFVFIGLIIALVQGGVVRRRAAKVGEQKMAVMGLIMLIPGLLSIGLAYGQFWLYFGLFFLSVGAAMAIPCLTTLVSLYAPATEQGRAIGIFRSLGALARVIGPLVAAIIYWRFGSAYPYLLGALFLILPITMVLKLPKPS